jgi:hypothetical protein
MPCNNTINSAYRRTLELILKRSNLDIRERRVYLIVFEQYKLCRTFEEDGPCGQDD